MKVSEEEKNRKLSPAEQKRLDKLNQVTEELEEQGYTRNDRTINIVWANVVIIIATIPVFIVLFALFILRNGIGSVEVMDGKSVIIFAVSYFVLIVVHELIHGLTWSIFAPDHWKNIEFGFMTQYLTPYCTCGTPLDKGHYILGALMPLTLLGLIPAVIAIFTGSSLLLYISIVMILSAGGDVLLVRELLRFRTDAKEILIYDHPTQAGCVVFTR